MVYLVMSSQEKMPSCCWGSYRRVAVVEFDAGDANIVGLPRRIDERTKGLRIVSSWRRLNVGKTERCAYSRALRAAQALAGECNRGASA